ncbi:MAG: LLM class flavin-dependent oxidoreductase [Propionibacteriaceae bacterium]|nr:LLM class flavin-dependent oxidoreductase [Propionibacteriaceae bacterium]
MADYGRELEFGWFADPAEDPATLLAAARVADAAGLDLIGVQDHPYNNKQLDSLALLSAMGAVTERIRLFPDVANLALRGAVLLANTAASIDRLTNGRFELGLGSGAFWDAIVALGGPRWTPGEARRATEEAIDVMKAWWSERSLTHDGTHFRVKGARPGPQPAHPIGIWLGVSGPRMLDLLGRKADGWLPSLSFVPPEKLPDAHARIDEGCAKAGREPSSINRIYNLWGDHSVAEWTELLTGFTVEHGMNAYVFGGPPTESFLRMVGEEIAPAVRAAVAAERGR